MSQSDRSATLVAIAKNESFYLMEWIAHHFVVGFQRIIVFNNDSTDHTLELLSRIAELDPRLTVIDWPSRPDGTPQESAYNHAVELASSEWIAFLDIDEFLVPWRHGNISDYLAVIPADISEIHVNWRGFGSAGVTSLGYGLVTETFTTCATAEWSNNLHYKSLVRRDAISQVFIHFAAVRYGRRCLTDFSDVPEDNIGIASKAVYQGIQINHYQCKTYSEFRRRMNNGGAYARVDQTHKFRDGGYERFTELDQNVARDDAIAPFVTRTRLAVQTFENFLPEDLNAGRMKSDWLAQVTLTSGDDITRSERSDASVFLTWQGTLLCRHRTGPEIAQANFFSHGPDLVPVALSGIGFSGDASSISLEGRLLRAALLPGNFPLQRAELIADQPGGVVSIRYRGYFLTAHAEGPLTLCGDIGDAERFLLLEGNAVTALNALKAKAWRLRDSAQIILPGQIRVGTGFMLHIGELAVDLRSFAARAPAMDADEIVIQLADGGSRSLSAVHGWRGGIAAYCWGALEDGSQTLQQIAPVLLQAGFEGYAVDFRERSARFHLSDGESLRLKITALDARPARQFDLAAIVAAVRQARRNLPEEDHACFCRRLAAAGCAGYIVSFPATRILYYSRHAETLVEQLSLASPDAEQEAQES